MKNLEKNSSSHLTCKEIIIIIYIVLYASFIIQMILPWYLSEDARTARDNLRYVKEYLTGEDIGLDISSDVGLLTTDMALKELYEVSSAWGDIYVKTKDERLNPYDTLLRLRYETSDTYVSSIYEAIMLRAAAGKDNSKEIEAMITSSWDEVTAQYDKKAEDALTFLNDSKKLCGIAWYIMTTPAIGYFLVTKKFFKCS